LIRGGRSATVSSIATKICPDCAESVQDAARKCRFCGYRFDGAPAEAVAAPVAAPPAVAVPEPAASPELARAVALEAQAPAPAAANRSPFPFLLLALGGGLVGLGGAAMCALPWSTDRIIIIAGWGGVVGGGALLAVAWGCLLPRGVGGLVPLIGSLVLVAGGIVPGLIPMDGDSGIQLKSTILVGSIIIALFAHLNALEGLCLDGARASAIVALIGMLGETIAATRRLDLPFAVNVGLACLGLGGTALFGIALAVGGTRLWLEARQPRSASR
jgi:hypothetical protein